MPRIPKVSILLPVYNGEQTLRPTMESLLSQTFQDFEILVGIDGTKDGSKAIAESFKDERIQILEHPKNLGLAGNMNALVGAMHPESAFFAIAEQDDWYVPERLAWQVEVLQTYPEVGLVSGIAKFVSDKNEVLFPGLLVHGEQFPQGVDLFRFLYTFQLKVVNTCMMVRREVHANTPLKFNNFYGNFNVDWDYVLRFCLQSQVYGLPKVLVHMNRKGDNPSVTKQKWEQFAASRQLLKNFRTEFGAILSSKDYRAALKEHRKIELGYRKHIPMIFYGFYYALLYRDLFFTGYLINKAKYFLKKKLWT